MAIVGPVEPAHEGRAHPGKGPGQGPHNWPISERFCQGEISESMWEDAPVPLILDRDVHDEIPKEMGKKKMGKRKVWFGLRWVVLCSPAPHL